MKKISILSTLFILVLFIPAIQAQDYLVSFAAKGDTTEVVTVKASNLTRGTSLTLNGGDILHLGSTVGIGRRQNLDGQMIITPNPVKDQATFRFTAPEKGDVLIRITDFSGKEAGCLRKWLSEGSYKFRISRIPEGMYFLSVEGQTYRYSAKLASLGDAGKGLSIEQVQVQDTPAEKEVKSTSTVVDMHYETGDQMLYTGTSGIYSKIVTDIPISNRTTTFNFTACTDADGNNYTTVDIGYGGTGSQIWMAENLRTTHFRNGDAIPNVTDGSTWGGLTSEAYCWYNNDESAYKIPYGALFNWYAVFNSRPICPTGFHVPFDAEWTSLVTILGGPSVAGGKLKASGTVEAGTGLWFSPNVGATNRSGFSAIPGGYRNYPGSFTNLGSEGDWWTFTSLNQDLAYSRYMVNTDSAASGNTMAKYVGFSLRCMKTEIVNYPLLNVPGSYQGWNPGDSTTAITSLLNNEMYEGYLWFPANNQYKYAKGSWTPNWGDNNADGTLELNGADIVVGVAGNYTIILNLNNPVYTYLLIKN